MIGTLAPIWLVLGWALAAFAIYAIYLNRIAAFMQPFRLRLAELGEELLASGKLSESDAEQISWYLDYAFCGWTITVAAFLVPLLFIPAIFVAAREDEERSPEIQDKIELASVYFTFSAFAANPIFGSIVVIEFLALALVLIFTTANARLLERVVEIVIGNRTFKGMSHLLLAR